MTLTSILSFIDAITAAAPRVEAAFVAVKSLALTIWHAVYHGHVAVTTDAGVLIPAEEAAAAILAKVEAITAQSHAGGDPIAARLDGGEQR